jgi:hypothetical protein
VISFIATVVNYEYAMYWYLYQVTELRLSLVFRSCAETPLLHTVWLMHDLHVYQVDWVLAVFVLLSGSAAQAHPSKKSAHPLAA